MTRSGMAEVINRQADLQVLGQASDASEAISLLVKLKLDLIVTDITMPGKGGIDFIKDVRAIRPELPVLVVTLHDESLYAERALRSGARGYLMKDAGAAKFLEAIRQVLSGQAYLSSQLATRMLDAMSCSKEKAEASPVARLTDREFEVFRLIGLGKTAKEIGEILHLSSKTVDVHRAKIKAKLNIQDVTALVSYAARWLGSQGFQPVP